VVISLLVSGCTVLTTALIIANPLSSFTNPVMFPLHSKSCQSVSPSQSSSFPLLQSDSISSGTPNWHL
jgi:hypothetical protein